jgi:glycosyltransferase involved in cell wall biosynthesis
LNQSIQSTIKVPFELIAIDNADRKYSIAQAYNIGAAKSTYSYLCFCHEDIVFHTVGWGNKIINYLSARETGAVGVVGSIIKTASPSGVWFGNHWGDRNFMVQGTESGKNYIKYANPLAEKISEVKVLDGLFIGSRKEVWEQNKFDESEFTDFHGYDLDFSMSVQRNYKLYVIYDIELEHLSDGGNSITWISNCLKVSRKWKSVLPVYTDKFDIRTLRKTEYQAGNYFIRAMIATRYKPFKTARLLLKMIRLAPFDFNNLRLIKYFTKNGIR